MPDLPSGTLAFLFTDIEGSTKRWERSPRVMAAAVSRHDALLRAAIAEHHGAVFKTVGDAFCAVFATVPLAMSAALAIQHALAEEDWDQIGDLRVRVAIHVGEAEERDDDYFGPAVNRVARLLSAGHGGQILLSRAAAELARHSLPATAHLRDLGDHRLKDLSTPEHVFQLVATGMPVDFPPLRSLDQRPHNLPEQPTTLIGRENELRTARAILKDDAVRLLTLTGPGGVGKTRLGLQVAAELVETFADGVWFVPLAALGHADLVVPAIAQALSVRQIGDQSLIESLIDELHDKHRLIILDNFEHVVPATAAVSRLIAACPRLKVLVTSRSVLHVYGERELVVPPLMLPDPKPLPALDTLGRIESVRLFVERAQAVKVGFALTTTNAPAIAAICVRLDGLPLAIELAAARVRMLPPPALLPRLENRLKLLTGGGVDRDPRQQTLRGAIAWSHDLLEEPEQTLFRRLSVFVGGCTIEAAETVASRDHDLEIDVFDGLASLVEKSLLRQEEHEDGEPRFVMLESIREFGLEALAASGEAERIRQDHATHYLTVAGEAESHLTGPGQIAWLDQLEQEHGNLDAALRWFHEQRQARLGLRLAGALGQFWSLRGHFSEGRTHLDALLTLPGTEKCQGERARALNVAGELAESQGDFRRATELHEEALAIAQQLGDTRGVVWALNNLGSVALGRSDFEEAQAFLNEALDAARALGDSNVIATSLVDLGRAAHLQSDLKVAADLYEQGLAIFRNLGNESQVSRILNNLGSIALAEGRHDRAEVLLRESLSLHQAIGDKRSIAGTLNNLAEVARGRGNGEDAAKLYAESQKLAEEIGDKLGAAIAIENLADLAQDRDDHGRACSLYKQALAVYRAASDWLGIIDCLTGLASIALAGGQPESAARLLGVAAALRDAHALPLAPTLATRGTSQSTRANARGALGQEAFATLLEHGRTMSLDDAWAEVEALRCSGSEQL